MITGIDVSKDTLDVAIIEDRVVRSVKKYANNEKGFDKLLETIKDSERVVMEATGPYYMRVAFYLHERGIPVSIVNPLVIRRYSQMKLIRTKTDRKDAVLIANYGQGEQPPIWTPPSNLILQVQQLETYLDGLKKRRTMASNQLHAFRETGKITKKLEKELEEEIAEYEEKINRTEEEIRQELEKENKKLFEDLKSIPGIGNRTASLMITATNGFETFNCYKQVIAYFGLAPRHYESGTSVRGRTSICKIGMSSVRKNLYMAAMSAVRYNKACRELYERLRAKGKPYKVAMIAVVNKLIKQAFAIAKSGIEYSEEYQLSFTGTNEKDQQETGHYF